MQNQTALTKNDAIKLINNFKRAAIFLIENTNIDINNSENPDAAPIRLIVVIVVNNTSHQHLKTADNDVSTSFLNALKDIFQALIEKGVDCNLKDSTNKKPIYHLDSLNQKKLNSNYPLQEEAHKVLCYIIKVLVEKSKININNVQVDNMTIIKNIEDEDLQTDVKKAIKPSFSDSKANLNGSTNFYDVTFHF